MAYKKHAPRGMKYQEPTRSIKSKRNADAFIGEETRMGFNDEKSSLIDILTMLQTLLECPQLWEQLLFASGGVLELSKYYYQLIHWHWNTLGYPKIAQLKLNEVNPIPIRTKLCSNNIFRQRTKLYNNCIQAIRSKYKISRDDFKPTGNMGRRGNETSKQK